jgi:hypothetical protein
VSEPAPLRVSDEQRERAAEELRDISLPVG